MYMNPSPNLARLINLVHFCSFRRHARRKFDLDSLKILYRILFLSIPSYPVLHLRRGKKLLTSAVLLCRLHPTQQKRLTLTEVGQGQRIWALNYMCLNRWWSLVARLLPTFLDWFSSWIISSMKYIADDSGKIKVAKIGRRSSTVTIVSISISSANNKSG